MASLENLATLLITCIILGKANRKSDRSSTSMLLTIEIQDIVDRLKMQRCRDSTRRTYHRIWNRFSKFFIRLDDKPDSWENRIILFVGYLIEECKLQSSTIRTYISALKGVLAEDKIKLNQDDFVINSLTRAYKIKNDQIVTRLPIHRGFLNMILSELDQWAAEKNQPCLNLLYKAMLATAYYGMLRVGEISEGPYTILVKNVHIGINKNKILFVLQSSKTHNKGNHPQMVKITCTPMNQKINKPRMKKPDCCPFKIIKDYIGRRPHAISDLEPFFVFTDRSPVTPVQIRSILKLMITRIGLDHQLYNVHSMRIGRCVDLLKYGVSVETIKKLGRWRSNTVFTYLRE